MKGIKPRIHRIFKVLSSSQILDIHRATTTILGKVGVIFEEEKALELFRKAGAKVRDQTVLLPPETVERLLKKVPSKVTLHARDARKSVHLGTNRVHYTNGYGTTFVKDLETAVIREASLEDLCNFTRLGDYLENVHYVLTQVIPQDVPSEVVDVYQTLTVLKNTEKHVGLSIAKATYLDQVIQIGKLASGVDKETAKKQNLVFSLGTLPISPLRYSRDGTLRLLKLPLEGVVTRITSGAVGGATAPVSLAGTLAVQNAEIIAGICLVQIVNPGNPVIYGTFAGPMDMLRGKQLLGAPESAILNAATAQLCRFYRIPFGYGTGGVADSGDLDIQAGIEKTYTLLYTALSGVDVIHNSIGGLLGGAMVSSYEQMLIDHEISKMVNRGLEGITVTPECLALDLIAEVGQHGNYLSAEHTCRHFKKELFLPSFFDRRPFTERKEEELEIFQIARERAKEILATHRPKPFSPNVEEKMDEILRGILKELNLKGLAFTSLPQKGSSTPLL
jgi:trimethylamine--corrinoid protein Co-methyltransferase